MGRGHRGLAEGEDVKADAALILGELWPPVDCHGEVEVLVPIAEHRSSGEPLKQWDALNGRVPLGERNIYLNIAGHTDYLLSSN